MQRLLAAATATTAATGAASISCGKTTIDATDANHQRGCGKARGGDMGSSGYAVVDPVPPPAHCPEIGPLIKAQAVFVENEGVLQLVVTLSMPPDRPDFKYVADAPVVVYGGTLVKSEVKGDGVTATLTVPSTATSVSVSAKGVCNQGPSTLSASVNWNGVPKLGTTLLPYVNQY